MFGSSAKIAFLRIAFLRGEIGHLKRVIEELREEIRHKPSQGDVIKWNDALDNDLRAEIKRLADALGYEVVVYGERYEKKGAKAK